MKAEQYIISTLEKYKRKRSRLTFIERRTKNKRIKKKLAFKVLVAARVMQTWEEIITNLGGAE